MRKQDAEKWQQNCRKKRRKVRDGRSNKNETTARGQKSVDLREEIRGIMNGDTTKWGKELCRLYGRDEARDNMKYNKNIILKTG